jgi:hypothetical protein
VVPDKKQQFNVYLSPELIREVKHTSVEMGGSLSEFVAQALAAYIEETQELERQGQERAVEGRSRPLTPMMIIYVRDVEAALPFYQALGCQIALRERTGDWIQLQLGDAVIGLHKTTSLARLEKNRTAWGLEFSLIVHEKLETLLLRLNAAGYEWATQNPIVDESFGRSVPLIGPEGLLIQVNELDADLYT